jgi:large subunit ribosomal protein L16
MLLPKKVKHRKVQRRRGQRNYRVATSKIKVDFGSFGLKVMEPAWLTSRQIEAARRAMTRYIKRGGKIWIRVFPDKPITNHGNESVMGGGKGSLDHFVAVVRPGTVVFEMDGVSEELAREAMRLAGHKLPVKTRFVTKNDN